MTMALIWIQKCADIIFLQMPTKQNRMIASVWTKTTASYMRKDAFAAVYNHFSKMVLGLPSWRFRVPKKSYPSCTRDSPDVKGKESGVITQLAFHGLRFTAIRQISIAAFADNL